MSMGGAFFHGAGFAAFADAGQAAFGLDHHHIGGLVHHGLALAALGIALASVIADAFDLVGGKT
jgi:hypothetical protein